MTLRSILRPIILPICLFWGFSMYSQISVVHVGPGFTQGDYEGVYYSLPRTALKIALVPTAPVT